MYGTCHVYLQSILILIFFVLHVSFSFLSVSNGWFTALRMVAREMTTCNVGGTIPPPPPIDLEE